MHTFSNIMQIHYATRFVPYLGSKATATDWQFYTLSEKDCEVAEKVKQQGVYAYYTQANGGRFLHRYEKVS